MGCGDHVPWLCRGGECSTGVGALLTHDAAATRCAESCCAGIARSFAIRHELEGQIVGRVDIIAVVTRAAVHPVIIAKAAIAAQDVVSGAADQVRGVAAERLADLTSAGGRRSPLIRSAIGSRAGAAAARGAGRLCAACRVAPPWRRAARGWPTAWPGPAPSAPPPLRREPVRVRDGSGIDRHAPTRCVPGPPNSVWRSMPSRQ